MIIHSTLSEARLALADITNTPLLDAELLLAHVCGTSRTWVITHGDDELPDEIIKKFNAAISRRILHEPIAYITGKSEFYGREFIISPDTLQPRPETETIVEMLLCEVSDRGIQNPNLTSIIDIGTGSGCLAITAFLELSKIKDPRSKISFFATDISERALKVAKQNAQKLGAKVNFLHGNLLAPFFQDPRSKIQDLVLLANLPYVPNSHTINAAARHEPDIAIFGGEDGLDLYRDLFSQLSVTYLKTRGIDLFTECLPPQHKGLKYLASEHGFTEIGSQDLIQHFRRSPI